MFQKISEKTANMEKYSGFFTFYWDETTGKIWLEIDKIDTEFLYVNSITAGLGQNDVGLDRNQLGSQKILKFLRFGPKLLLIQPNYSFRAISENPWEVKAVEDGFVKSIIWGFEIEAEEKGNVLIDATFFFLRDEKGVIRTIKEKEQGEYELDISRSSIYMHNTKNFPLNTEIEAILTFTSNNPGDLIKTVAPDPWSLSFRQHHSLIELPDENYEPRKYDFRSNFNGLIYYDYATPIEKPVKKLFLRRHRLKKKNPDAAISEPIKPVIYYLDRAVPEPIRTALLEGANWWNQAFEAIGYKDAFRAEILPEDADPLDVRYNMINWVHRTTRGWSYGNTVTDPRTGEILKGHVSIGSRRIRQDFLIAKGLVTNYLGEDNEDNPALETALARIRQLSIHEVGHAIGLGHNYASNINDRASVMDYPAPLALLNEDGTIDLSKAYASGVGEFDKVSIAYGYQDFPEGVDEEKELKAILEKAFHNGLLFAPGQDAGPSSANAYAASWINGKDPVDELNRMMNIREKAMKTFSENKIRVGDPMATLEEVLLPIYLFHRFQLEATASVLGGLYYHHTLRGDIQENPVIIPGSEQLRALEELLRTIEPKTLMLDETILNLIPARPPNYPEHEDLFPGHTGQPFDPLGAAETAANLTLSLLLNPQRAARLVEYHSRRSDVPSLGEVLDEVTSRTWKTSQENEFLSEVQRVVNNLYLYKLIQLAKNNNAASSVRSVVYLKLDELKNWLGKHVKLTSNPNQKAHYLYGASQIKLFQENPEKFNMTKPLNLPKGAPI